VPCWQGQHKGIAVKGFHRAGSLPHPFSICPRLSQHRCGNAEYLETMAPLPDQNHQDTRPNPLNHQEIKPLSNEKSILLRRNKNT
jgi:hypothetical protein